ncbi:hypothetical protein SLEP1_g54774 [Rubroshorea leprosula]|uniref:Leucine-rich repeat-containing N-terminal plant-type domain-containing protein n=1 Tax=Rubroshorea leprosula TaxID=152421 RepID=A0AAV5MFK3_9ROSI|nr:hypothetical protein SLEP1_g54774 [Rubroshorea leprosula]
MFRGEEKKNCCEWEGVQCSNTTGHITMLNLTTYVYGHDFILRESISSLNKIQHLDLFNCNLSGSLPSQLANLISLQYLDLGYNNFNSVKNLEWLSRLSYLQYLYLSEIDLSKVNNDWLQVINKLPHLTNLSLYRCNLRDVIPQYVPIINTSSTSLVHLDLGSNNLTASTFQWLFNFSNSLVSLRLRFNQFRGPIPETFSHMTLLERLSLSYNQFEGEIPKSFWSGNLSSLRYLYLSSNKLSGDIPKSIGLLSKLEVLDISFNSFNGVITEEHFSTLSNLWSLGMSSNNLSINFSRDWIPPFQLKHIRLGSCKLGPDFPSWLKTQRNFIFLNISANRISNGIPIWFSTLPSTALGIEYHYENLTFQRTIDLSSNKLTGEIPVQISSLFEMHQLNLSRNHLIGRIPPDIGQIRQLESLDLSHNRLSGRLPLSMSQLYSLSKLDLSYNNISGRIPTSTQMDTFNASAFAGNPTLCGPPLTPSCPGDEKLIDDGIKYNQQDKDEFWKAFQPSMKLGMAFGFLGVLALKIDHPWKHVCFLLSNYMEVYLSNLKDCLCLIVSALCLVITASAAGLRRKLKF